MVPYRHELQKHEIIQYMHHIISSKCTTKCCEKGGAYRRKSP